MRIYFKEDEGQYSPVDFCKQHFPSFREALAIYNELNVDSAEDYKVCADEHPPYSEVEYDCEECSKRLTDENA